MQKCTGRITLLAGIVICLLLLCACGAPAAEIGPVQEPAETMEASPELRAATSPEPTPEPTPLPTHLVIKDENVQEILAYAAWTQLESIDATASQKYEALLALQKALPNCEIRWIVDLNGTKLDSLSTTSLTLRSTEGLLEALRYLPRVTDVDLLGASVPDAVKDELLAAFPNIDFLWEVRFARWKVRSDLLVFSTLGNTDSTRYSSEDFAPLFKYCRHLKALDLGHNDLQDLSLLGELKELQVLILADNPNLVDISPLANLTELRYLELFTCLRIEDFSCLKAMSKMEDINLCFEHQLTDASVFEGMSELKVAWLRFIGLTPEERDALTEAHPDANISFLPALRNNSATDGGWRATEENIAIRTAFLYYRDVVAFEYWDGIEYREGAKILPAMARWED